ncbi:MAG: hypothetical protein STHCBS139747_004195 [Sporothrix thermara]
MADNPVPSKTADVASTAEYLDDFAAGDDGEAENENSLAPGSVYRIKVERSLVCKLDAKMFSGEAQAFEDHSDRAKLDAQLDSVAGPAAGQSEIARRQFRYML